MDRRNRLARRVLALLITAAALLAPASATETRAQARPPGQTFTSGDLAFEHPAGWAVTAEGGEQMQTFVVKRAGVNAEIKLMMSPRPVAAPGLAPEAILKAARQGIIAPRIERLSAAAASSGQRPSRSPVSADFGGTPAEGERLLFSLDGVPVTVEFYALLYGGRPVVVSFLCVGVFAPPEADAAWETFRRTLRFGQAARAGAAAVAARAAPQPPSQMSMSAFEEAKAMIERVGELSKQAMRLRDEGKYADAIPLGEQALALAERGVPGGGFPPGFFDPAVAMAVNNLAELHKLRGDYRRAEPLFQRALAIREKAEGPAGEALATPLHNLAAFYVEWGEHARAEPLFRRAVAIFEKTYGPEHPKTATAINNLASFYSEKNDYARAEELYRRALSIRERALGAEHEDVAASLNNLAAIRQALGDYEQAERLLRRARAVMEKALGAEHPTYATALGNLAQHYQSQGDLLRAEPLYRQALAVAEKALGPDHPNVALVLANTAHLLAERGDAARAEQLQRRALAIREKTFGPENPNVAHSLNGLALLLMERREYGEAERLLSRSLAASEKAYGPEHGEVATILDNLAALYYARGEHARAAPLITRAHAVREKIFGPASREVALSLGNLAALHSARGEYARAEELYRRSLATYERALGPRHPDVASALSNLSSEYLSLGDTARAVQAQQRAEEIREHHLSLMLTTGSEAQKRLYMATLAGSTDYTVFLHASAAPRDPQALRLALTTLLRRKGRVLDAMSDQMGALRRRLKPEDRAALDQLAAERARLAALSLGEPGKRTAAEIEAESGRIGAEVERLEAAVGARPVEARERPQAVTLEAVQAAIPGGAALVEFALYRPYNVKARARDDRWLPPRYAAYVVRRAGAPSWFDLGDAASLDKAVADLRAALTAASREDVRALARALDERLMRPARALAPDARHFFVSPDGALNLVPFAALVDEQDRYLVETHMITYLTSGRDLLRARVDGDRPPAQQQAAVVLADPAFDVGVIVKRLPAADGRRSADLASMQFARLPGAADEARAISSILTGARVLTDGEASEAALKQVSRPALLHIATHGFFLGDQGNAAGVAASRGLGLADALARPARGENPLLRSGLALSGANARRGGGGEDGILTALEAAGLDLWGTRLVTLSACNTAVGEVQNGDGVYGLRRALVLAGSESQLMSLWPVSDYATRDLMVEYYRRLQAGEGRGEALRRVQLEMLTGAKREEAGAARRGIAGALADKAGNRSHPFYWAAFIQSGDWRPMR